MRSKVPQLKELFLWRVLKFLHRTGVNQLFAEFHMTNCILMRFKMNYPQNSSKLKMQILKTGLLLIHFNMLLLHQV